MDDLIDLQGKITLAERHSSCAGPTTLLQDSELNWSKKLFGSWCDFWKREDSCKILYWFNFVIIFLFCLLPRLDEESQKRADAENNLLAFRKVNRLSWQTEMNTSLQLYYHVAVMWTNKVSYNLIEISPYRGRCSVLYNILWRPETWTQWFFFSFFFFCGKCCN